MTVPDPRFLSKEVLRILKNNGLKESMGRTGSSGDNAAKEAFFSLLQTNLLNIRRWDSCEELRVAIVIWIEAKHNRHRRQRALWKLTLVDFETVHQYADVA